jgi:hypothetical protein
MYIFYGVIRQEIEEVVLAGFLIPEVGPVLGGQQAYQLTAREGFELPPRSEWVWPTDHVDPSTVPTVRSDQL